MDRRTFVVLLGLPVLAALLDACGAADDKETVMLHSDLARTTADPALAMDGAAITNALGHDLFRWLAVGYPTGNVVCSPVSIALALAMAAAGASGTTRDQLLTILSSTDPAHLHSSANSLTAAMESRGSDDVTIMLANSIWGQKGFNVGQPFLDVLASEYGSGMETVDFAGDTEAARHAINGWIDERTHGRVPELIAAGALTNETRLTLVNALYLKAPWQMPFVESATRDDPFTTISGETVDLPTMVMTATVPYSTGDGWVAAELPFEGGELAMVVLLPEVGYLDDFQQQVLITDSVAYFEPTLVTLHLPRFDVGAALSLQLPFEQLGVVLPFSDNADFSGISTDEPIQIDAIWHQANITVDEHGAEAAAATALMLRATGAPVADPIEIVVDRPFLFVIRDRATGAMLFLGRVGDPRGT